MLKLGDQEIASFLTWKNKDIGSLTFVLYVHFIKKKKMPSEPTIDADIRNETSLLISFLEWGEYNSQNNNDDSC